MRVVTVNEQFLGRSKSILTASQFTFQATTARALVVALDLGTSKESVRGTEGKVIGARSWQTCSERMPFSPCIPVLPFLQDLCIQCLLLRSLCTVGDLRTIK